MQAGPAEVAGNMNTAQPKFSVLDPPSRLQIQGCISYISLQKGVGSVAVTMQSVRKSSPSPGSETCDETPGSLLL